MENSQTKQAFTITASCKLHPEQTFLSVCMEKQCQKRYELCCSKCQSEFHFNHNILSLYKFLETYNTERDKYFQELDSLIAKLIESYDSIDKDFSRAIECITQARVLVKNSVQSFKEEFNSFEDEILKVEGQISNIKRNNLSQDEIQDFLDSQIDKSSFFCSFKDINKSYKFSVHAKQFLAYFTEQSASQNKIFGDKAKQEGMLLNLKSLNGSAEVLKNQARILLSSKQDFSFLNKQLSNNNNSNGNEIDKIPIKELTIMQWNEIQHIMETANKEVVYSLPQVDFTIVKAHQKEQVLSLLKNNKRLKTLRIKIKHFQQFEDGSLSEVLNENQQQLENIEIFQQNGIYQEINTRKLLESLTFTSLRRIRLDLAFQKPQMHNDILKILQQNHWLQDINLNFFIPDKSRQKIQDYINAIIPNQILKRLKFNFDCSSNPPYFCQDTLKLIEQFFANNKEIELFIIGQGIVCEYYREFHKILREYQNPNLKIFEVDAKPAHKVLSIIRVANESQDLLIQYKAILENNPHLTSLKLHNFDPKLMKFYHLKKKALQILTQLQFKMQKFRKEIIQEVYTFLEDTDLKVLQNDKYQISKTIPWINF